MPSSSPAPRASLARSILIKMGVRVGVVIALMTIVSYLHILGAMREQALTQLERHVVERSQREQAIFVLAEDNHAVLKRAFEERVRAWEQEDPSARFDSLFVQLPDGSIRSRPEGFDGKRMTGVFVNRGVSVDLDFRRRLVAAYEVVTWYGPAFHVRFTDTYIMLPEGAIAIFWPEGATWSQDLDADHPFLTLPYFTAGLPQNNPRRHTVWTGIFEDEPSRTWMVSVTTPLDLEGRHVATIGHDVLLDELIARTTHDHLPGAHNLIFRDDGQLIVHPQLKLTSGAEAYDILAAGQPGDASASPFTAAQQAYLRSIFEQVMHRPPGQGVLELPGTGEYLAVGRLAGPQWNFVTVLPERLVASAAFAAARNVLLFGLASLLLELVMMYWVLRQQITRPLLSFTQATDKVAAGDFKVSLESSRDDELGQLAQAFQLMAHEVRQREESLRQANEGLEQRVEERTRDLREVHRQLVETARRAGMAEVATNVLHNVGNVLTSINTSTNVARERLARLKLEQVGRVAGLLQENQAELVSFLTEDERGRNILPFLSQLSTHMMGEHREILSLLKEVGRHIKHIETIVQRQQTYAKAPQLHEPVLLEELMEDALRINAMWLLRHEVQVERRLAPLPPVLTDKHKVLTILVNLISNATYALEEVPKEQRRLTITLEPSSGERLRLVVQDTGVGIAPELLTRIFQFGFTTRKEGHGFGLHSCALAAQELGGSLQAHSEGPGHGATFTLELPLHPKSQEGAGPGQAASGVTRDS